MADRVTGGWSNYDFTLTPQAKDVFETALEGLPGARYTPLAFASLTDRGTRYSFLCEVVYPSGYPIENAVKLTIHHPSEGRPLILSIQPIAP